MRKIPESRPRKGAWIEIFWSYSADTYLACRPRKGAWIEIGAGLSDGVILGGRPRKGAWIEMQTAALYE